MRNILVYVLLIILIIFRYFTTRPIYHDGDRVRISARILSEPIRYETYQYLKVAGLEVYIPLFPEISYGDSVVVEGEVDSSRLRNPKLISVGESKSLTSKFRNNVISFYQETLSEPFAGLIAGITLGSKSGLTNDFWQMVKRTGVAHVVVASGMNVTFVTSFLVNFLAIFFSRKKLIPFVILGIILYLFISGFDAPLVRAAIMGGLAFLAQETGRLSHAWRILVLTAFVMLVIRPDWTGDVGFILSFVATGSLLLFERKASSKFNFLPKIVRDGLSTSLAAQIGVAPILFVTFGYFNVFSPIINALVLWTVPIIMILGALGGIVGLLIPVLGKLMLYLCYPLLWWFVSIVTLLDF